ncbi:MAG: AtpZ/AtpI family protein [Alphaproteobacteria bacterium]|nr:AtpZ/AtpI family protein [Alphaproteobacteria bacterium]
MTDPTERREAAESNHAAGEIERRASQMQKARDRPHRSLLFGLGMFGMIGWSVAVPTLAGIFLGLWLDRTYPLGFSWTITLLFMGVVVGALVAWRWVRWDSGPD